MRYFLIVICLVSSLAFSFSDEILMSWPKSFGPTVYQMVGIDSNTVGLGRALFYDPLLSKDNSISCDFCHSPFNAFAHTDHKLSHGFEDQVGTRNAPPLFNLAWHPLFMQDGAVNHLDVQALAPISNPIEMGESLKNIVVKLDSSAIYPELFEKAFGTKEITGQKVLKSLAHFQLTLVSDDSKYDRVVFGKAQFSEMEKRGYALFQKHCNECHTEPLFSSFRFMDNGLPIDTILNDYGRGVITQKSEDSLKFKVPSLRNLGFTAPYMHDGRFQSLREVLNHYSTEKPNRNSLPETLKAPLELNDNEKTELLSFLKTLNDTSFVFDKRHWFPKEILLKARD